MIKYLKMVRTMNQVLANNEQFLNALLESQNEPYSNLTWEEDGVWKGWTFNSDTNRYYFDDIGTESITGLWEGWLANYEM